MGTRSGRVRTALAGAAVVVAVLLVASACGGGSTSSSSSTTSSVPQWPDRSGTWTFLVYVDADNNLEGQALTDLRQMASTTTTKFVVLVDRARGYSTRDLFGLGDFADSAMLLIADGDVELLATPGELNMGAPDTLSSFITYGLKNHRGEKNALVLWDHGGSWKGVAWDDSATDPTDPKAKDRLTLPEVAAGTRKGLADAGVDRFDLYGFDACLMATYEVAMTVQPFADVMVASEETEPGHGWNWTTLGTGATGATTKAMSDAILQGYRTEAAEARKTDITLSSLDLHAMGALTAAIERFTDAVRATGARIGRVGYGRDQAISFGKSPNPEQDYFSVDLGALASEIQGVDGMGDAASALSDAVHEVVIRRVSGTAAESSTGIAAYFPSVQDYFDPDYARGDLAPSWLRLLDVYYGAADRVPDSRLPYFLDDDGILDEDNVISDDESVELLAKVQRDTGGNIIAGYLYFGQSAAGNDLIEILGDVNASVAGDTVSGAYGWRYLVISDGVTTSPGYSSINLDSTRTIDRITVPIVLTDGAQTAEGSLVLNMDGENILGQTFYVITDDSIAAIEPRDGLWFYPLYESYRLSTEESEWLPASTTPMSTASPSLSFDFERLPVGTSVFAGLGIFDVKGGADFVIHRATAPPG